ncbi:MAG TPA: recombinase family protein [Desulfotomaculum sp.]|nr:recombinase family protein [Desulfotomaculum sp.]
MKKRDPRYAFSYARVSDPRQAQKDVSVPEQLRKIREYADREGITILREFTDLGKSAYRDDVKRDEFERMIQEAKGDPRVSLILVHDMSRFVRRRAKAVLIKADLAQYGVRVIPVLNPYDSSTIAGFWMEAIDETRAEAESMATSMHTLEKMKGSIAQRDPETGWCYKNGGRAPAGYKNIRVVRGIDHRGREIVRLLWEIDEEWGPRIQFIIRELRLKENMSFDKIRDYCNQQGWLSPEGRPVTTSFIREIFRKDRLLQLAGYAFWNREDRKTRGRRFKPEEEWVVVPNAHPALITEEEALRCRRLVEESAGSFNKKHHPQENSRFLLTGKNIFGEPFFICTHCGGNIVGDFQGGRHKLKYQCSTIAYEGKYTNRCLPGVKLEKDPIEQYVFAAIKSNFGAPERIRRLVRDINTAIKREQKDYHEAAILLEKQAESAKKQIANLVNAIAKGTPPEYVNPEIERIKKNLEEIEAQKRNLLVVKPSSQMIIDEEKVIGYFCRLDEIITSDDNRLKRHFIRSFIRRLEFDPDTKKVEIFWFQDPVQAALAQNKQHTGHVPDVRESAGVGGGT